MNPFLLWLLKPQMNVPLFKNILIDVQLGPVKSMSAFNERPYKLTINNSHDVSLAAEAVLEVKC